MKTAYRLSIHNPHEGKTTVESECGGRTNWIDIADGTNDAALFFPSLESMAEWAHNVMQQAHKLMEEK